MPNNKNVELVQELKERVAKAKTIIFAEYQGITATQVNELRQKIKEADGEVTVAKNTLMKIALEENKVDTKDLKESLEGSTMTIIGYGDEIAPLKALVEFAKKLELPRIKAALINGQFTSAEQTETISKLPAKEILLAQVVGSLKSPLSGFVNVLGGSQKKFVYAVKAIADKKSE